jgi:hypothetical protein
VLHRRGIRRPKVGEDELEARAVPHSLVRGTLPERIIYKYLVEMFHMIPGVDFDFQSCVASNHKVLTADLRWVDAGSLVAGDELLSFTEDGDPMRKWTKGTVTFNKVEDMEAYKVKLSDGREIITTPNHPWLVHYSPDRRDWGRNTGYSWVETQNLRIGGYVPVFVDVWDADDSREAGWVAGFFDGEGAVVHGKTQTGGHSLSVTIGQNKSIMLDRFNEYAEQLGYEFTNYDYTDNRYHRSYDNGYRKVVNCRLAGGRAECLRFLGSVCPAKLKYLNLEKLGKLTKIRQVQIVSVEPIGNVPIARLEVDKHTYIAEGFGMHNSLQGGRIDLGGIVADFLFPQLRIVINPMGPTHEEFMRMRKDDEQTLVLAEMGYTQYLIWEWEVYDEARLDDWMNRNIRLHQGGDWSPEHDTETTWLNDWNPSLTGVLFRQSQMQEYING